MKKIREQIIEGMLEICENCGACIPDLGKTISREVDEYIMPKIQPLIDGIKQNAILFP